MALVLDGDNGIVGVLATNADGDVIIDTSTFFVDADLNRVGIGTTTPNTSLHISAGSSGGSLTNAFEITDSGYTNIQMLSGGADGEIKIGAAGQLRGSYKAQYAGTSGSHNFNIGTNATNAITIDTSQRVGIGTTNPSRILTIENTGGEFSVNTNPAVRLNNTTSGRFGLWEVDNSQNMNIWNGDTGSGKINFYRGGGSGTHSMTIDGNGNVGIGTNDPGYAKLHVINDSSAGDDNFILMLQNTTTVADSRAGIMFSTNSGQGAGRDGSAIQASNNGVDGKAHLTFGNVLNNVYDEKVRFTTDGNVGIGTDNPTAKLHLVDSNNVAKIGDLYGNSTMALEMYDSAANPVGIEAYSDKMVWRMTGAHKVWMNQTGDFYPQTNGSPSLGLDNNRWNNAYIKTIRPEAEQYQWASGNIASDSNWYQIFTGLNGHHIYDISVQMSDSGVHTSGVIRVCGTFSSGSTFKETSGGSWSSDIEARITGSTYNWNIELRHTTTAGSNPIYWRAKRIHT